MKKLLIFTLLCASITLVSAKDITPEFDGVYLQTKDNKFIELEGARGSYPYFSYIKRIDSKRMCINSIPIVTIKLSQLKYLVLKNQRWKAEHFEKQIIGNHKREVCESYDDADRLKIRTKSKGDTIFYKLQGVKEGDIYQFIVSPNRYVLKFI